MLCCCTFSRNEKNEYSSIDGLKGLKCKNLNVKVQSASYVSSLSSHSNPFDKSPSVKNKNKNKAAGKCKTTIWKIDQ